MTNGGDGSGGGASAAAKTSESGKMTRAQRKKLGGKPRRSPTKADFKASDKTCVCGAMR